MPLLALWKADPTAVAQLSIEQIVANAGDGRLGDNSAAAKEFREYLAQIPSERLGEYAGQCLTNSFPKSGLALQDLVNELGRRLDYAVENGRYQGVAGRIGFDGIWRSPGGSDIVIEVKTTDAYRISLDTIADYSRRLFRDGKIGARASVLIVVGRKDTGELEAQVRGSRHAWDMRLISVDALVALVKLKESTEAGDTGRKIRSILTPMEYTRLDSLVDVLFTAAKDAEATADSEMALPPAPNPTNIGTEANWQFTDPELLNAQRIRALEALGKREATSFIRRSRALYWNATHQKRAVCTVSKRYTDYPLTPYWYAYHPSWDSFLGEAEAGWFVLGCMGIDRAFALPVDVMRQQLDKLNTTLKKDGSHYWHIKIMEPKPGAYVLQLPKEAEQLDLKEYELAL